MTPTQKSRAERLAEEIERQFLERDHTYDMRDLILAGYTAAEERARKLADALKLFIARCTDEDMKDAFRLGRDAIKDWEDGK